MGTSVPLGWGCFQGHGIFYFLWVEFLELSLWLLLWGSSPPLLSRPAWVEGLMTCLPMSLLLLHHTHPQNFGLDYDAFQHMVGDCPPVPPNPNLRAPTSGLRKVLADGPRPEGCVTPDRATASPYPPLSGTVQKALWMPAGPVPLCLPPFCLGRPQTGDTRAQAETGIHHLVHPLAGRGPGSPSPADQT